MIFIYHQLYYLSHIRDNIGTEVKHVIESQGYLLKSFA